MVIKSVFPESCLKRFSMALIRKTGLIDYGEVEKMAKKYQPKIIISGASAYPRKIDFQKLGKIAKKIGAYHLAIFLILPV